MDNIQSPTKLKVLIKSFKTDPFCEGVQIFMGKTSNVLCPVTAMLAYLAKRGSEDGFLFKFQDGRMLSRFTV